MADEVSVDPEVLASLKDLGGEDDPDFFPGLVREFLKHLDDAVPALKRAIARSFAAAGMRPCTSPTAISGRTLASAAAVSSAACASSRSDSSINGQTQ